jgi:hypothetical protein
MKYLRLFEQFVKETSDSVLAGDDSSVEIDAVITSKGKKISAQEILGAIVSSDTEKEIEQYFYDKYGEGSFSIEAMSSIKKAFNDYGAEQAEKEKEEEKEEGGDAAGAEGGEEGESADLEI